MLQSGSLLRPDFTGSYFTLLGAGLQFLIDLADEAIALVMSAPAAPSPPAVFASHGAVGCRDHLLLGVALRNQLLYTLAPDAFNHVG